MNALDKYLSKYDNLTDTRICVGNESNAQLFPNGGAKAQPLSDEDAVKVF